LCGQIIIFDNTAAVRIKLVYFFSDFSLCKARKLPVTNKQTLIAMTTNAASVHGARNDISSPWSAALSWVTNDHIEKPVEPRNNAPLTTISQ